MNLIMCRINSIPRICSIVSISAERSAGYCKLGLDKLTSCLFVYFILLHENELYH